MIWSVYSRLTGNLLEIGRTDGFMTFSGRESIAFSGHDLSDQ